MQSEQTIAPCPVCGGSELVAAYYTWSMKHFIQCKSCRIDFAVAVTADEALRVYNELSRASALLRAVEAIDASIDLIRTTNEDEPWRVKYRGHHRIEASGHTAADALIALAEKIEGA